MAKRRKQVDFPEEANTSGKPPEIDYDTSIPEQKASRINITEINRERKKRVDND